VYQENATKTKQKKMFLFKLLLLLLSLLLGYCLALLKLLIHRLCSAGLFPSPLRRKWRESGVLDKLFLIVVEAIDFLNFELCMTVS
jgi:hypothetical protein